MRSSDVYSQGSSHSDRFLQGLVPGGELVGPSGTKIDPVFAAAAAAALNATLAAPSVSSSNMYSPNSSATVAAVAAAAMNAAAIAAALGGASNQPNGGAGSNFQLPGIPSQSSLKRSSRSPTYERRGGGYRGERIRERDSPTYRNEMPRRTSSSLGGGHPSPEDDPSATRTLFVGNLPPDIRISELRQIFDVYVSWRMWTLSAPNLLILMSQLTHFSSANPTGTRAPYLRSPVRPPSRRSSSSNTSSATKSATPCPSSRSRSRSPSPTVAVPEDISLETACSIEEGCCLSSWSYLEAVFVSGDSALADQLFPRQQPKPPQTPPDDEDDNGGGAKPPLLRNQSADEDGPSKVEDVRKRMKSQQMRRFQLQVLENHKPSATRSYQLPGEQRGSWCGTNGNDQEHQQQQQGVEDPHRMDSDPLECCMFSLQESSQSLCW
ncbi:hypothetical protein ECG_02104 [Echinococcus granulosus]|nr:hypothetical protein ECG_02104 [Echinococcus granulosus]